MSNEEFEDLFGNVPFENIRKINEYIDKNFISKQVIRDKIEESRKKHNNLFDSQTILKEILGE